MWRRMRLYKGAFIFSLDFLNCSANHDPYTAVLSCLGSVDMRHYRCLPQASCLPVHQQSFAQSCMPFCPSILCFCSHYSSRMLVDLDKDLEAGGKSLDDIIPRGNAQPEPPRTFFGSFTSSSVTRDSNGVS